MVPITKDTPLWAMRRHDCPVLPPPSAIGMDDWAWRRNQRYGTLICDLDRHRTIALLPNREPATTEDWLLDQQQTGIVGRDRGGAYAQAISQALPHAIQVADRWHLMENASHAFLDAVRKSMRQIRVVIGATTVDSGLLTAAEHIQYEGYLRWEETNGVILALAKEGIAIKEIVRRTGHSRKVVRGQRSDMFRIRESSLDLHLPWLDAQCAAGRHNATDLWRRLRRTGFRGNLRIVGEWATRRRRSDQAQAGERSRTPAARTIARLLTIGREALTKAETVTVAAIEGGVPMLVEAREIVAAFQSMIRKKNAEELEPWLQGAKAGLVGSFANGVAKDRTAVIAAITLP
ncbi:transposase [Azospirillum melinis]|nr:transposase [Azospirillum melinis]